MTAYDVVLFFHIAVLLLAFALAGLLHGSEWLMVRARTVAELRTAARPQKLGALFAVVILALLGLGFSLLHLSKAPDKFAVGDPFAWTAIVVLALLFLDGPLVMGRHAATLGKALDTAADGPVTPELRALTTDRTFWLVGHMNTFTVMGVVLNMATKPTLAVCLVDIVGFAVLGAVMALLGLSRARVSSG